MGVNGRYGRGLQEMRLFLIDLVIKFSYYRKPLNLNNYAFDSHLFLLCLQLCPDQAEIYAIEKKFKGFFHHNQQCLVASPKVLV